MNKIKTKIQNNKQEEDSILLEELRVLNNSINKVDNKIKKHFKISRIFFRGIVHGIGATIGASLLAGGILVILAKVFSWFELPINNISEQKIERVIKNSFIESGQ